MKQQTAVEWSIEELEEKGELRETFGIVHLIIDTSEYINLKRKAKEMEKQQSLKDIQYALLHLQPKIKKAAELLMGISDTYDINDIEIYLDWMLSTGEIPDEYPKEVMNREYESIIIYEVEKTMDKPFG